MVQVERMPRWTQESAVKVATVETPTHLLGWLPFVWTGVLFPGPCSESTAWRWRPFAIIFVLTAAILYPCMSFHLFEPDEGRYAQIPREMLERGEWLVPVLQGEPYLDKPPLFYWLVMLSYSLFGYHEWAARLIPALAIHTSVLLVFGIGRRLVGERSAFWGALLLIVSPFFLGVGRLLVLDGLLTLWITLAWLAGYHACADRQPRRGWWLVAALACALGVLTKGPVALLLVVPPLVVQRWLNPVAYDSNRVDASATESHDWNRMPRLWLVFVAIILAVNLPWYAAVCVQRPEFGRYFLLQHNIQRFVEPFDHVQPVWFYAPYLLSGLLPITLLAWPLMRFLTSTRTDDSQKRCPAMGYLLLVGLWCVFFFSLAGSKLPTYILPAFPPLCLALGCFVARTDRCRSRWVIGLIASFWLVQAFVNGVLVPAYARQRSPMADAAAMRERCGDPATPVVCFPRHVDSVAFATGRSDFRAYRSKEIDALVTELDKHPRTVVLFGHHNSPGTLARHLPAHLRLIERRPMGLYESALIVRAAP